LVPCKKLIIFTAPGNSGEWTFKTIPCFQFFLQKGILGEKGPFLPLNISFANGSGIDEARVSENLEPD
jgi:hypothetical protein